MFTSSLRASDAQLLHLNNHDPSHWVDPMRFGRGLATGTYRREWTWLAFVDDATTLPVARGVWWGPVGSVHPVELHCLLVHASIPHPEVWGAALVRSAHRAFADAGALLAPDVVVEVSTARRHEPEVERALDWRRLSAAAAGMPVVTETAGDGVTRVSFTARPLTAARPQLAGSRR